MLLGGNGDGGGCGDCQFGNLTLVLLDKLLLPLGGLDTLAVSKRCILRGDRLDLSCCKLRVELVQTAANSSTC